jgi:hypothetical protein
VKAVKTWLHKSTMRTRKKGGEEGKRIWGPEEGGGADGKFHYCLVESSFTPPRSSRV